MPTLWFWLVAFMIAMYVVLDGFDLGAAIAGRFVARTPEERSLVLRSIGPVWDGNEVWLVAGGGTLFCAFPALYATSFSGFYLPLMVVLWLLIGRGVAIELRGHVDHPVWDAFWDAIFLVSSSLLCLVYGVALGNVVRGVPLGADGEFFLPLWTDFRLGLPAGILDVYTLLVGVAAVAALSLHGALWLTLKLPGELEERARRLALPLWGAAVALTAILTAASFAVQPLLARNLAAHPWGYAFPLLAVAGIAGIPLSLRRRAALPAFLSSCVYLVGLLTAAAFGLFPYVLPALPAAAGGMTVTAAAASDHGLRIALAWWIPGMLLAASYTIYVYRSFAGKVAVEGSGAGH